MGDLGSSVQGWLTDLSGIVSQAVAIKQQVSPATSPVTVAKQPAPAESGMSTGMIALGVLGLIVVVILVKKVL